MKTNRLLWLVPLVLLATAALGQTTPVQLHFTSTETFTGIFIDFGTAICPGNELTGGFPPCPQGSRTQLRNMHRVYQDAASDPRANGTNLVSENWNFDENFCGPMWGTFRLTVSPQEVWEGTWTGYWEGTKGRMRAVGHGSGGRLEGLQIMYECQYTSGAGGPCVGRILSQKQQ